MDGSAADRLTGVAGRTAFLMRVEQAIGEFRRGDPPSLLTVDLDDFASVNDVLGYPTGDRVLVAVATLLRDCSDAVEVVGRLDGDQFGVLTRGVSGPELETLAEQIRAALAGPLDADGRPVSTRSCIGVAQAAAGDTAGDLLSRADSALRAAKTGGRGRLVYYQPRMKARLLDQSALLDGLPEAISGGQLELVYQPVVQLENGSLTGLESLARWRHPVRGPIMPGEFIPIAERSGLIVPLGRWMLAEACREQGTDWPLVYVNVSAHQLRAPGFARTLGDLVSEPGRLAVEVTEEAVTEPPVVDALREVRELGVRVVLDDFGLGPGSMPALAGAPIDVIKLHGSIAEQIVASPRMATVARGIARIADDLGVVAIAKAVESAAQAERLHELGYRQGMGFHFAVPQPATAIPLFLNAGDSFLAALA